MVQPVARRYTDWDIPVCVRGAEHHAHTTRYAATLPQITFTVLKTFIFSDFNKEPTSSLKMIWKDRNMVEGFQEF